MAEHWIIVGAGSAGCVLANRLSADPDRHVTLLDDGPALEPGNVPAGVAGPSFFAAMSEPGRMHADLVATRVSRGEATLYQRGRGIGGSSAVNAMVALRGDNERYRRWGWHDVDAAWDRVLLPTTPAGDAEIGAINQALLTDRRAQRMDLTRVEGQRVTSAEAYLWPALTRSNLQVHPGSPVDRIVFNQRAATGVRLIDGTEIAADRVVLAAGAIHSPVVLLRSGVDTPGVGRGLQDHPSAVFTLQLRAGVQQRTDALPIAAALHTTVNENLLQLLPMDHLGAAPETRGLAALMAALMTPVGRAGSVRIDDAGAPIVDFALLHDERDLRGLADAVHLALTVLQSPPFVSIVDTIFIDEVGTTVDALGDDSSIEAWLLRACGDYVHASSSCAMGVVVDQNFAVTGYRNLYVCDASVFPSIPEANTHLPSTMVAERFGLRHG